MKDRDIYTFAYKSISVFFFCLEKIIIQKTMKTLAYLSVICIIGYVKIYNDI